MAVEARGDCAELSRQPSAERLAKLLKRTGKPHVAVPGGVAAVAESVPVFELRGKNPAQSLRALEPLSLEVRGCTRDM